MPVICSQETQGFSRTPQVKRFFFQDRLNVPRMSLSQGTKIGDIFPNAPNLKCNYPPETKKTFSVAIFAPFPPPKKVGRTNSPPKVGSWILIHHLNQPTHPWLQVGFNQPTQLTRCVLGVIPWIPRMEEEIHRAFWSSSQRRSFPVSTWMVSSHSGKTTKTWMVKK